MELIKIKVSGIGEYGVYVTRVNYPNHEIRTGYNKAEARTVIAELKEAIKELEKIGEK